MKNKGLFGSSGYVEKYLVDPTTKNINPTMTSLQHILIWITDQVNTEEFILQENELVRPIFEEWLKPFADMGCSTITIRNTSGTDHLSFDRVGLPGFPVYSG